MSDDHLVRVTRSVHLTAADPHTGLTLDELTDLVAQAHSAELPADSHLNVKMGWRGQIKALMVERNRA